MSDCEKNVNNISHLLLLSLLAILDLDLHEAGHLSPAYRALVGLHPHDLRALYAQAHVAAREHGITNGWFDWPHNFDPRWLVRCDGFEQRELV
jgi:hypothetical protein